MRLLPSGECDQPKMGIDGCAECQPLLIEPVGHWGGKSEYRHVEGHRITGTAQGAQQNADWYIALHVTHRRHYCRCHCYRAGAEFATIRDTQGITRFETQYNSQIAGL